MEKNSNLLIKTIIFILIVSLSCLVFFGLGKSDKTDLDLISFGFITFAELVVYISITIPSFIKTAKLENSDFIAVGVLHLIGSLIINIVLINKINDIKTLIIYNVIEIIVLLILLFSLFLRKK